MPPTRGGIRYDPYGLIVAYPRRLIKFGHHNYSTIQQRDATCRYLLLSTIHYHAPLLYDVRRSQLDYNPTNHVATCWYNATPLPRTPAFITTLYNVVLNCKSIMIHPSIIWCFMGRCRLDKYSAMDADDDTEALQLEEYCVIFYLR